MCLLLVLSLFRWEETEMATFTCLTHYKTIDLSYTFYQKGIPGEWDNFRSDKHLSISRFYRRVDEITLFAVVQGKMSHKLQPEWGKLSPLHISPHSFHFPPAEIESGKSDWMSVIAPLNKEERKSKLCYVSIAENFALEKRKSNKRFGKRYTSVKNTKDAGFFSNYLLLLWCKFVLRTLSG